jgi:threonine/homoserine/homoserine lactone efflux protein
MSPSPFSALTLAPLVALAFATTITPGPNNLMLLASGLNFGWRRTLPCWAGVVLGFSCLIVGVGLGLGAALGRWPALDLALRVGSALVILWMAWRIAGAKAHSRAEGPARPMRFFEAAAFQWINPKAWMMAVAAVAGYAPLDRFWTSLVAIVVAFWVVGAPANAVWIGFGVGLRRWLDAPGRLRLFNRVMAALLLLAALPMIFR